MKHHSKHFLYTLLTVVVIFSSCRKEIQFDPEWSDPKLVMNALMESDSLIKINLSRSKKVTTNDYQSLAIKDAIVSIYADGVLLDKAEHLSDGVYISPFTPVIGTSYEIKAFSPYYDEVSATTKMLDQVPIVSIDSISSVSGSYGEEFIIYSLKINDPGETGNFYRLSAYFWNLEEVWDYDAPYEDPDTVLVKTPVYFQIDENTADVFLFNEYLHFNDDLFNGESYELRLKSSRWNFYNSSQYTVYFVLTNIDKELYHYNRSLQLFYESSDFALFSEPVSVHSNVEGGYGIVSSANSSVDSLKMTIINEYEEEW